MQRRDLMEPNIESTDEESQHGGELLRMAERASEETLEREQRTKALWREACALLDAHSASTGSADLRDSYSMLVKRHADVTSTIGSCIGLATHFFAALPTRLHLQPRRTRTRTTLRPCATPSSSTSWIVMTGSTAPVRRSASTQKPALP